MVSTTKTKLNVLLFKRKINKTELFRVGYSTLSNVCEFTYLLAAPPKFLSEKAANRTCFALNKHLIVKDILVVITLKLLMEQCYQF